MYSLDINFLSDRKLNGDNAAQPEKAASKSLAPNGQETPPLIAGGVVAAICLAAAGFLFWNASKARAETKEEILVVDQEIQEINAKNAKVNGLEQQIASLKSQSEAFVNVLQTKIKPWSAILQEISDLTPPTLKLSSFAQTDNQVLVSGHAQNFTNVNDLMINLQASPLFVEEEVYIVSANLVDNPAVLEFSRPVESFEVPQVVEYTVAVTLRELTDAEIIQTLEQQGARGMAERLKTSF
ncbi:Fimbrial assembly family protein [[Leptolyngbya] sp. PCC 7376]|uniref:PilN domain-containing protein n=1 Tax=[Leptolyngbya] sp. PCC 7376 TaxID=111781 RepID=UPI00029F0410|nr:PilN domain-containing protein [[Leptolyngbya] sp. PCC 7376]AFY40064.1 Fimbrial assembly family protein [[Leptolyngbya] sp. PCC 7376]